MLGCNGLGSGSLTIRQQQQNLGCWLFNATYKLSVAGQCTYTGGLVAGVTMG